MATKIITKQYKRVDLVEIDGRIDSSTAPQLEQALANIIKEGRFRIVVDMSETDFMSSAGLRAINQLYNALRERSESQEVVTKGVTAGTYKSPHLKLLYPSNNVLEVLKTAGFDMYLEVYHNLDQAVAAFGPAPK